MSVFPNFVGDVSLRDTVMFSDFVSSARPFSTAISFGAGTTAVPVTFSNSNDNGLGFASCILQGVSNASVKPRSGIYISLDMVGGTVPRAWTLSGVKKATIETRCRTKTVVAETQCCAGFSITHNGGESLEWNDGATTYNAGFYANGGTGTWQLNIVEESVVKWKMSTSALSAVFHVLRVEFTRASAVSSQVTFSFFVDGAKIASKTIDGTLILEATVMPCVEARDRSPLLGGVYGSGVENQGIIVDYMEVLQTALRD